MSETRGSCQCGHVVFAIDEAPRRVVNCHCRMCQKAHGAPFVTWAEFSADAVRWTAAEPVWRASSDAAKRGFCPKCGTPMAFLYNQGRDIDLPSVLFDDPEQFPPKDEIWTQSLRSWVVLNEQLPHHVEDRPEQAPQDAYVVRD